jgi:hypothetical protein
VRAFQGVVHRLQQVAVRGVPLARAPVQLGDQVQLLVDQPGAQDVREQVVVAVPAALVVEGDDEQVLTVERLQRRPSPPPACAVTTSQSGPLNRLRMLVRSRNRRTCAGSRCRTSSAGTSSRPCIDRAASWSAATQPSRAAVEGDDVLLGQLQPHGVPQVRRSFAGGEAQIGGTHLDELSAGTQPGELEWGVDARREHHVGVGRQVVEQVRHALVHGHVLDDVVVVQDEIDLLLEVLQVVEQLVQTRLRRCVRRLQQRHRRAADVWGDRPERRDDVRPDGSLSRESSDSHAVAPRATGLRDDHSLSRVVLPNPAGAETSVRLTSRRADAGGQPWALQRRPARCRNVQLRLQQHVRHGHPRASLASQGTLSTFWPPVVDLSATSARRSGGGGARTPLDQLVELPVRCAEVDVALARVARDLLVHGGSGRTQLADRGVDVRDEEAEAARGRPHPLR